MYLRGIATLLLGFISFVICAQPEICGDDPDMTPFCADACIICDIDGFSGNNNDGVNGEAPPGYCTFIVHNAQWIGFIATSVDLTLAISVSNCSGGGGLEVGIYESFDCESFALVSQCLGGTSGGGISNNTTGSISNMIPLVIGQYYYFVMDGLGGAVCDFSIEVTEGSTEVPDLEPAEEIFGESQPCLNGSFEYSIDDIVGAPEINWYIDGDFNNTGNPAALTFTELGFVEICIEASNVCSPAVTTCRMVEVVEIPETDQLEAVCEEECFFLNGIEYCEEGLFPVMLQDIDGCDSLVNLTIEITPLSYSTVVEEICEGDSIEVAGLIFNFAGNYDIPLEGSRGCDSIVTLELTVLSVPVQLIQEDFCIGGELVIENVSYTEEGDYTIFVPRPDQCDSVVFLQLRVNSSFDTTIVSNICMGHFRANRYRSI